ncbi:Endonuclease/exonuclease/phosphatase, partial [Sesbania bispinosa]
MIAKKCPRSKRPTKAQDSAARADESVQAQQYGSRFHILETESKDDPPPSSAKSLPNSPLPPHRSTPLQPPRVRNPLGGKNPQHGAKPNSTKQVVKPSATAKGKSIGGAPSKPSATQQSEGEIPTKTKPVNNGSLLLPGTQVFGPGKDELGFLQNLSHSHHDPGPIHHDPGPTPHDPGPPQNQSQHLRADCDMPQASVDEHMGVGFAGGIWCFWDPSIWAIDVIKSTDQVIHFYVSKARDCDWFLSVCYGSPRYLSRHMLWDELISFHSFVHHPWIVLGDFNSILFSSEKIGGSSEPLSRDSVRFHEVLNACQLMDGGFTGEPFTWKMGSLKQRLDRALFNLDWRMMFEEAIMGHLPFFGSDHCPLLLSLNPSSSVNRKRRPLDFLELGSPTLNLK